MVRPSKTRRVLKWVGTVGCVLLALAWATSLALMVEANFDRFRVVLSGGGFGFCWFRGSLDRLFRVWGALPVAWLPKLGPATAAVRRSIIFSMFVPFWCVAPVVVGPTAYLWWRDRRRIPPGYCQKCGYNLTGNVSGRCPECGSPVAGTGE